MKLNEAQIERYSRNIILREVGVAGQVKLLKSRVLIVGAGGLGSPAALYLAAAGVGTIGVMDSDVVELNNLQRQIVHRSRDVGRDKAQSAREKMAAINPEVDVIAIKERLRAATAPGVINGYDFVIDGSDNFPTKFLINDACHFLGKPYSHGGVAGFAGQTMTCLPGTACLRCVCSNPPPPELAPGCQEAGILGAVAGILGCIQAAEALRYLLGAGKLLVDRMLIIDAYVMRFDTITIRKNPGCPLCGRSPTITSLVDEGERQCGAQT